MGIIDRTMLKTGIAAAAIALNGCTGILSGVYDEPSDEVPEPVAGQLYIDASDWGTWHYIDLAAAAKEPGDTSPLWSGMDIPTEASSSPDGETGIYTYWYDVFGAGISVNEFRSFEPTAAQPEPESWTIAVHRNNVRTNGCSAAATPYADFTELPDDRSYLGTLSFEADRWSENEVWCVQDRMLLGLIGSQGIAVNPVLSSWLSVDIPPMPPSYTHNSKVFVIRLSDGSYGALRLRDYISPTGTKCCLTIDFRYPI